MAIQTSEPIPGTREDGYQPTSSPSTACGQCGRLNEVDCASCSTCGSLLPDPDANQNSTYSGGTDEVESRPARLRVVLSILLVLCAVASVVLAIHRATTPDPEEQLAEESAHRALAVLKSLSETQTLDQTRDISSAAKIALSPVVEMLPRLSSNNETRPRLDAYRSLFRGVASLDHLHRDQLLEWGKARQTISSSLGELAAGDPMTGVLTSQGRIALDAIQDQVDQSERIRSVTARKHSERTAPER